MSTDYTRRDDGEEGTMDDPVVEMAAKQTGRSEESVEAEMAGEDVPVIGEDVSREWLAGDTSE